MTKKIYHNENYANHIKRANEQGIIVFPKSETGPIPCPYPNLTSPLELSGFNYEDFHCKCRFGDCQTTKLDLMLLSKLMSITKVFKFKLKIQLGYCCEKYIALAKIKNGRVPEIEHSQGIAIDFKLFANPERLIYLHNLLMNTNAYMKLSIYREVDYIHIDNRKKPVILNELDDSKIEKIKRGKPKKTKIRYYYRTRKRVGLCRNEGNFKKKVN